MTAGAAVVAADMMALSRRIGVFDDTSNAGHWQSRLWK